MQGTKIRLLAGGLLLMMATAGYVQADALQPDPAWQQGTRFPTVYSGKC